MAGWFTEGLEVTQPYPARVVSLHEQLEDLYAKLVSPVKEIRLASSQRRFARKFSAALRGEVEQVDPDGVFEEIGLRQVNGVQVDVGFQTTVRQLTALWHPLSLQAKDHPDAQIAAAKALAMDLLTVRQYIKQFETAKQLVALQPPKAKASDRLPDSIAWLNRQADDVFLVSDTESLAETLRHTLEKHAK